MFYYTVMVTDLIAALSKEGAAFSYIPEYYLETMADSFHSLRRINPPFPFTSDPTYKQGLTKIITSFITHLNDPRAVNPGNSLYVTRKFRNLSINYRRNGPAFAIYISSSSVQRIRRVLWKLSCSSRRWTCKDIGEGLVASFWQKILDRCHYDPASILEGIVAFQYWVACDINICR